MLALKMCFQGRGGGQVVSVLAFYSDYPSSNPTEVYNFSVKLLLKRTKINKKEAGVGPFKKNVFPLVLLLQRGNLLMSGIRWFIVY